MKSRWRLLGRLHAFFQFSLSFEMLKFGFSSVQFCLFVKKWKYVIFTEFAPPLLQSISCNVQMLASLPGNPIDPAI